MNIRDLQEGSYKVIPEGGAPPMNINNLKQGSYKTVDLNAFGEVDAQMAPKRKGIMGFADSFNKRITKPLSNVVAGAAKGAASTIATVPTSVGKVAAAAVDLETSNQTNESLEYINFMNEKLAETAKALPDGDPKKERYLKHIQENNKRYAELSGSAENVRDQASAFTEKPDFLNPEGTAQKVGYGAEKIAEFLVPGGAIKQGEKALKVATDGAKFAKTARVAGGAVMEGVGAGVVTAAQGGDLKDVRNATILAGALSVPFKAYGVAREGIAKGLQESAEKKASQALGATTKRNKELSDKIVPELLKRKTIFLTRGGLVSKAANQADEVGEQIGQAFDNLPPETKVVVSPIIKSIEDAKSQFVIKGTTNVPEAAAGNYKALQNIQKEILDLAKVGDDALPGTEPTISVESLRSFRQILDGVIKKSGKTFGLTGDESVKLAAQKEGANAIRATLADEFPNIAKLNKEFSFWKNVEQVVGDTVQRTKAQNPISGTIAEGAGVVTGAVVKGTAGSMLFYATMLPLIKKAVTSPAWRMTSAVARSSLANAIMRGAEKETSAILNRIISGSILRESPEQKEIEK